MAPAIQLCLVQSHIASWSPSIYISRVLVCLSLGGSWSWRVPRPVSHFPCFLAPGFQVPAHCLMRLLFSMQRADTLVKASFAMPRQKYILIWSQRLCSSLDSQLLHARHLPSFVKGHLASVFQSQQTHNSNTGNTTQCTTSLSRLLQ